MQSLVCSRNPGRRVAHDAVRLRRAPQDYRPPNPADMTQRWETVNRSCVAQRSATSSKDILHCLSNASSCGCRLSVPKIEVIPGPGILKEVSFAIAISLASCHGSRPVDHLREVINSPQDSGADRRVLAVSLDDWAWMTKHQERSLVLPGQKSRSPKAPFLWHRSVVFRR
jgi:hypothetical protein